MTEINLNESLRNKMGRGRMKKSRTIATGLKIDMTPMVDLGFLLISFFIFTTEISKPATTNLYMPHDGDPTKIPDSRSMTILLNDNDKVFYYYGNAETAIRYKQIFQTSFDELIGLGNMIRQKQMELEKRKVNRKELIVLIKPGKECSYKNIVNSLDEMLINGVIKYSITDIRPDEKSFLKSDNK
jgi:biopolymer transport protein ExbD